MIGHKQFPISVPLQLCLYIVPLTRNYHVSQNLRRSHDTSHIFHSKTFYGFQGGLQIGGWILTSFRYIDDIILLATSEAELQELVGRVDGVSRKYSLLINVDKTKVIASNGIACHILIQNEQLEHTLGPRLQKMVSVWRNSIPG